MDCMRLQRKRSARCVCSAASNMCAHCRSTIDCRMAAAIASLSPQLTSVDTALQLVTG